MRFFTWIAGIFEDQAGSASSKRVTLFIVLFYLWMIVRGSLEGKTVNEEVLFIVGILILFCVGAITTEFIAKVYNDRKTSSNKTETTEKESTVVKTEIN